MSALQILTKLAYEKLTLPIPGHVEPKKAEFIRRCLSDDPTSRPNFDEITKELESYHENSKEEVTW